MVLEHLTVNQRVPGSNPGGRAEKRIYSSEVGHRTVNATVVGSIPTGSSNKQVSYKGYYSRLPIWRSEFDSPYLLDMPDDPPLYRGAGSMAR